MITAVTNGRIKKLIQLNLKSRARREADAFVAEGRKMFLEAPLSKIREVYISESFVHLLDNASDPSQQEIREKLKECRYEVVSDEVFARAADTKTPQGILCVLEQFHYNIEEIPSNGKKLWVLLEDLQDPGNLGTIFRTGEGAGITGVIMTRNTVDIYNPKTIRATMGSIYRVPFLYVDSIEEAVRTLQKKGVRVYAAHLEESRDYDALDFCGDTAFLIGNEGKGLKRETADLADAYLRIPMCGRVESLNASVAASVLMYEAFRQRRKETEG